MTAFPLIPIYFPDNHIGTQAPSVRNIRSVL